MSTTICLNDGAVHTRVTVAGKSTNRLDGYVKRLGDAIHVLSPHRRLVEVLPRDRSIFDAAAILRDEAQT